MTIATDMGFEIGKLYRVINDEDSSYYKAGMIVRFSRDDGSGCPQFELISGKPRRTMFDGLYYIELDNLEFFYWLLLFWWFHCYNLPITPYPDPKHIKQTVLSDHYT